MRRTSGGRVRGLRHRNPLPSEPDGRRFDASGSNRDDHDHVLQEENVIPDVNGLAGHSEGTWGVTVPALGVETTSNQEGNRLVPRFHQVSFEAEPLFRLLLAAF